jgi:hypothetical protein
MGKLEELMQGIDRLKNPGMREEEDEALYVAAVVEVLQDMTDRLEKAATSDIDLKGVEGALKALAGAMSVTVEPAKVSVEAPQVTVEAPQVTVEPAFEVTLPDTKDCCDMQFDIVRNREGLMQSVIARPYQDPTSKPETIEYT